MSTAADIGPHVRLHYLDEELEEAQGKPRTDRKQREREQDDDTVDFVLPDPSPRAAHIAPWGAAPPVPVFRPTVEEFRDPLGFIASISQVGRKFGICKIVPPAADPTWKPHSGPTLPRSINPDKLAFRTKQQHVHQLKHRASRAEAFHQAFAEWQTERKVPGEQPHIDGVAVDLWDLLRAVVFVCGPLRPGDTRKQDVPWEDVLAQYMASSLLSGAAMTRLWGERLDALGDTHRETQFRERARRLQDVYLRYLHAYEVEAARAPKERLWKGISEEDIVTFGYAQGAVQTLSSFRAKAQEFWRKWRLDECSVDDLERTYWRIIEQAESRVEVEYGNDLSVVQYGSGFSVDPSDPMSRHSWNLNVLPKLPTSLFHHTKEVIHGVTDPMLYFGMAFTSFAWHVEDHFLYSINYHHSGAPKVWYGAGSDHADALEGVMKRELPELFEKHPDLLHQLVTAISPADLRRANVPVYKAVQAPGEFVVTFPRGYHCGFNSGFNLAEAVNFAMPDWIPSGIDALHNYVVTRRKCAFSHQELILTCARAFPVTHVSVNLLQELYRLASEYDEARHAIYRAGVNKDLRGTETSAIPHCQSCLADCYFASVKCTCTTSKHCCLSCVDKMDWCRGDCEGKYLHERVPMALLDSLIKKLEARLILPQLCSLRGCPECKSPNSASAAALVPPSPRRVDDAPSDPRVVKPLQQLARRGGLETVYRGPVPRSRRAKVFSFTRSPPRPSIVIPLPLPLLPLPPRQSGAEPQAKRIRIRIDKRGIDKRLPIVDLTK